MQFSVSIADDIVRAKIDEIYGVSKKKGGGGGSKPMAVGGGAPKATLDHNGKLIWD